MNRKALLAVCLTLVLFGAGCAPDRRLVTQVADQGDRLVALESQFSEVSTSVAAHGATIEQLVEADEAASATPLAKLVHEEQHGRSEMIDGWLGTQSAGHGGEG